MKSSIVAALISFIAVLVPPPASTQISKEAIIASGGDACALMDQIFERKDVSELAPLYQEVLVSIQPKELDAIASKHGEDGIAISVRELENYLTSAKSSLEALSETPTQQAHNDFWGDFLPLLYVFEVRRGAEANPTEKEMAIAVEGSYLGDCAPFDNPVRAMTSEGGRLYRNPAFKGPITTNPEAGTPAFVAKQFVEAYTNYDCETLTKYACPNVKYIKNDLGFCQPSWISPDLVPNEDCLQLVDEPANNPSTMADMFEVCSDENSLFSLAQFVDVIAEGVRPRYDTSEVTYVDLHHQKNEQGRRIDGYGIGSHLGEVVFLQGNVRFGSISGGFEDIR